MEEKVSNLQGGLQQLENRVSTGDQAVTLGLSQQVENNKMHSEETTNINTKLLVIEAQHAHLHRSSKPQRATS